VQRKVEQIIEPPLLQKRALKQTRTRLDGVVAEADMPKIPAVTEE
jgi:hypothetical protein